MNKDNKYIIILNSDKNKIFTVSKNDGFVVSGNEIKVLSTNDTIAKCESSYDAQSTLVRLYQAIERGVSTYSFATIEEFDLEKALKEINNEIIEQQENKKTKTILIDIDDTIENLCETWVDWLNRQYGTSVKYEEITEWDISKFFPSLTKEQIYAPLHNPMLWEYVKPKAGAVEYVKKLIDEGYNVYLCTSTDYRNVKPKFESVVQRYFPYIKWNQVIIAYSKQMISGDVLVDDGVHNLENGNYIKILVSASHNANYDAENNGMYRANTWKEIYDLIHKLIGEPNNES